MTSRQTHFLAWTALWIVLVGVALVLRPLMPLDETRYLAVAWEMWREGNLLVPFLNGEAYSHKPPLLFWLINAGWAVVGPSEYWARLVAPAFGLASVFLTYRLAQLLWPGSRTAQIVAPWILCGVLLWDVTTTVSMFDTLVMFFVLVGLNGLALSATARDDGERLRRGQFLRGWALFAVGVGLGVLSKGPVVLVFTLPPALLAPFWWAPAEPKVRVGRGNWYGGLFLGVLLGALIALAWALPAALVGGDAFGRAIFLGQTTERVAGSFSHGRPFWWYAPMLLALLFPWIVWPTLWRGVRAADWRRDPGLRFVAVWLVGAFVVLSLFTDKQPHYFLPAVPAFALLAGRALTAVGAFEAKSWAVLVPVVPFAVVGGALVVLGIRPDVALSLAGDTPVDIGIETVIAGGLFLALVVAAVGFVGNQPLRQVQVLAVLSVACVVALHVVASASLAHLYDLRGVSTRLKIYEAESRPIVYVGKYHGQFHYLGRLEAPIDVVDGHEVAFWFAAHPDGVAVYLHRRRDDVTDRGPLFVQPFRGRWLAIWDQGGATLAPQIFTR
jgi:4-amino-4-deoxy-L-arabinose transferase-like glycosyltransferase